MRQNQPHPCSKHSSPAFSPFLLSDSESLCLHRHRHRVCTTPSVFPPGSTASSRSGQWCLMTHACYTCWPTREVSTGWSLVCSSGTWVPFSSQVCPEHLSSFSRWGEAHSLAYTWELDLMFPKLSELQRVS